MGPDVETYPDHDRRRINRDTRLRSELVSALHTWSRVQKLEGAALGHSLSSIGREYTAGHRESQSPITDAEREVADRVARALGRMKEVENNAYKSIVSEYRDNIDPIATLAKFY